MAIPSTFSILERIVVVETNLESRETLERLPFSILERIVVVETADRGHRAGVLDVFQYPRTDRGG